MKEEIGVSTIRKGRRLRPGELHTQIFGEAIADFRGKAIMHTPRAHHGNVDNRHGSWGGHGNDQPDEGRQGETELRPNFEPERMARSEVTDYTECDEEHAGGNGGENYQGDIDRAVEALPGPAIR